MTPEFKKQWTDALRSGKYKQHRGDWIDNYKKPTQFCCLSVALTEAGQFREWANSGMGGGSVGARLKIDSKSVIKLMNMNDQKLLTFDQIADWIDANDLNGGV